MLEGEITSLDDLNTGLRSMIKDVVETAMGAEMTGFLGYDRYQTPESDPGNRRNGYSQKELASKAGLIVIDKAKEWQNRPLEPVYAIVFMDALFLKLRVDGRVKNVAASLMVGIDLEGRKECLGIWLGQSESAKDWLGVLNEFKNRGVSDVLIFAVDGLTGFPEAIKAVYPQAEIQRCHVQHVRNSLAQMSWKDRKEVATCLRSIYTAPTEEAGLMALAQFEETWGRKYPHVVMSWRRNWDDLATLFKYPDALRRLIYTNPIESLGPSGFSVGNPLQACLG